VGVTRIESNRNRHFGLKIESKSIENRNLEIVTSLTGGQGRNGCRSCQPSGPHILFDQPVILCLAFNSGVTSHSDDNKD